MYFAKTLCLTVFVGLLGCSTPKKAPNDLVSQFYVPPETNDRSVEISINQTDLWFEIYELEKFFSDNCKSQYNKTDFETTTEHLNRVYEKINDRGPFYVMANQDQVSYKYDPEQRTILIAVQPLWSHRLLNKFCKIFVMRSRSQITTTMEMVNGFGASIDVKSLETDRLEMVVNNLEKLPKNYRWEWKDVHDSPSIGIKFGALPIIAKQWVEERSLGIVFKLIIDNSSTPEVGQRYKKPTFSDPNSNDITCHSIPVNIQGVFAYDITKNTIVAFNEL